MRISDWSSDVCSSDLVRAADGDEQKEADQEAECRHRPEHPGALVDKEIGDQAQYAREHTEIDDMAAGQHDRLAGHVAVQLQKGYHRPGEGESVDGKAQHHLDPADLMDYAQHRSAAGWVGKEWVSSGRCRCGSKTYEK